MLYHPDGYYRSKLLEEHGILHGFGTKGFFSSKLFLPPFEKGGKGGIYNRIPLNPPFSKGECNKTTSETVTKTDFLKISIPKTKQIHSNHVQFLSEIDQERVYIGDGWLSEKKDILCYIRTADCLPLLLYDPEKKIVGAVHAGWRGLAKHIVRDALELLRSKGSRSEDIIAVIGPRKSCVVF